MSKEEEECEFKDYLKGCALHHISEARKLISEGKFEDADAVLRHAEEHIKKR